MVYWGKKEGKGGGAMPIGPLASITAPILGKWLNQYLEKSLLQVKNVEERASDDDEEKKNSAETKNNAKGSNFAKWDNFYC